MADFQSRLTDQRVLFEFIKGAAQAALFLYALHLPTQLHKKGRRPLAAPFLNRARLGVTRVRASAVVLADWCCWQSIATKRCTYSSG